MTKKAGAFTLIEMLVVISIIAILSSMIYIIPERNFDEVIACDALVLQSTLDRARSLAMSTGNAHGVAFHIENAGDGSVLKNKSILDDNNEVFIGRHWYCIIGPDSEDINYYAYQSRSSAYPPLVKSSHGGTKTYSTLMEYADAFREAQIGPRIYLSEGVRFLALSDVNQVREYKYRKYGGPLLIPEGHAEAPPRSWFGWYNQSTNTLYPWGAYNPEIDRLLYRPNTGLDYEGYDEPAVYDSGLDTNVSPDEVWGRINLIYDVEASTVSKAVYSGATANYPDLVGNGDSEMSSHYNRRVNFIGPDTEVLAKKPRPLLNAYWCDYMIYFLPSGAARVTTGHGRSAYLNRNSWSSIVEGRADMGIQFKEDLVAGYTITICRDVDPEGDLELYPHMNGTTGQPDYNKFASVEDAFKSITPFLRVYVNKYLGETEIRSNEHPTNRIKP